MGKTILYVVISLLISLGYFALVSRFISL